MTTIESLATGTLPTPIGDLTVVASARGLREVRWGREPQGESADAGPEAIAHVEQAMRELHEYFRGERRAFGLALDLQGTEFQRQVWGELTAIPQGETRTYGELARVVGRPAAARAVGAATGRNPAPVVVPCHRVVGANGSLTGFAGGLEAKRTLLTHEGALPGNGAEERLPGF